MMKTSRLWRSILAIGMLCFAAFKVGFVAYTIEMTHFEPASIWWFIGTFIFFYIGIFPRAIKPNAKYVLAMPEPAPLYHCFRPRTWLIMVFMMGLGVSIRAFKLADDVFIAGFYLGLALSLLLSAGYYVEPIRAFMREGK